ncbi:MAG: PPOX class F420-dependent oxidoreductase [Terriglobia bacterium]
MSSEKLGQFAGQKYLNLESYRKDGRAVRTPVWFAEQDGVLYAYTYATAGKVKRIRRNPRVRLVPCNLWGKPKGEWVEATARIEDVAGSERGERLLRQKYGWKKIIGDFFTRLRHRDRVVLSLRLD